MATARDRSLTHRLLMLAGLLAGFNVGLIGIILAHTGSSPREAPPAAAVPLQAEQGVPPGVELVGAEDDLGAPVPGLLELARDGVLRCDDRNPDTQEASHVRPGGREVA